MRALAFPLFSYLGIALLSSVRGEEFLLYSGPKFTTPSLGLRLDSGEIPGEDITLRRVFYIDSEKLPRPSDPSVEDGKPEVSAERAIQLVTEQSDLTDKPVVTRLELLSVKRPNFVVIRYYLIEYEGNGSTEYRVVLMDGRVLKPRLEKLLMTRD